MFYTTEFILLNVMFWEAWLYRVKKTVESLFTLRVINITNLATRTQQGFFFSCFFKNFLILPHASLFSSKNLQY